MNDNDVKNLWRKQPLREPVSAVQLVSAMQNKTNRLRGLVASRDVFELVACALVIIVFGYFFYRDALEPISRLGEWIVIGSTLFIAFKLVYTRRRTPPASPSATLVEALRAELRAAHAQSQLLGSILWWYILPADIGCLVMTWGNLYGKGSVSLWGLIPTDIATTLLFVAIGALVYWLNQHARTKQLLPLEAQLESLLRSAETGEPLDEAHVASLQPIVLAAADANQVKPLEFKISLWQLAIFGVPAIVGFWFIWTIERSKNEVWNTTAQIPAMVPQSFLFDASNRCSIVAQKVVDLFNTGDYASIHKLSIQQLYNSNMDQAFPPTTTFGFYTQLADVYGRFENIEGPTDDGFRGWRAFRLHCERGEMTMSLALDTDDRISGIQFRPVLPRSVSISSITRRFFSWRHLVWLPVFFAGGLLYSWLFRVWVGRAVGISAIGVEKGLTLILWDEIKEVRPLRFLHIRNLWLVKESGEKTLIHWTPLERHADLKAAVERFAPPNHLIRKHLALLRQR
jgi:hypothetical protein